jgi:4a-hydroxytetrahydrobiopterin dehydratase
METPKVLSTEEIESALTELPGWTFAEDKIRKQFQFQDFVDSIGFVNRLVPYFESMDHHPDTSIMYSRVRFDLQRFDAGGKVTDRDIEVAKEIEKAYAAHPKT